MKAFLLLCVASLATAEKRQFFPGNYVDPTPDPMNRCVSTIHRTSCKACCDTSFHGLLAFAQKPECYKLCDILPQKRQLAEYFDGGLFQACEAKGTNEACKSCCTDMFRSHLTVAVKQTCDHLCDRI